MGVKMVFIYLRRYKRVMSEDSEHSTSEFYEKQHAQWLKFKSICTLIYMRLSAEMSNEKQM